MSARKELWIFLRDPTNFVDYARVEQFLTCLGVRSETDLNILQDFHYDFLQDLIVNDIARQYRFQMCVLKLL
jgi:hypothetical protein